MLITLEREVKKLNCHRILKVWWLKLTNITTNQILQSVRAKVLETTTEVLSDSTLLLYVNLVYQDVYKRIFPNDQILSATVTFTSGTGTLPAQFGTLYGDALQGTSNNFPELSIDDFNKQTLSQAVTIEGGSMKVYPTSTTSLMIKYYPTFPDLTTVVNPTINSYFHIPIVYGAVSMCLEDLQDEALSKYYFDKFEVELAKRTSAQSMWEEGNQRSAQMFGEQNLIGGLSSDSPNFF